jgi:hypothetical protein
VDTSAVAAASSTLASDWQHGAVGIYVRGCQDGDGNGIDPRA